VLVVQSERLPEYSASTAAFQRSSSAPTIVVHADGAIETARRRIREIAREREPMAVFALGAQAAAIANAELPDLPMVFAMVRDWQARGLQRPGAAGVTLELPVDDLLTRYKLMLPNLRRIGVICSADTSAQFLAKAHTAARRLDLHLLVEQVAAPIQVGRAYERLHGEIDALWMIPDPGVVTKHNFAYLADRTRSDDIAFLAFSESFVHAGALLAVTPSYSTMGSQAAALLERLLGGSNTAGAAIVQSPLGTRSVVNAATARAVGLTLDATLMSMADVIIDPSRAAGGRFR
jgi:ABC-type uncharacterized transport system substrate-binding protein